MAHRTALSPPSGPFALITQSTAREALAYAKESPRRRVIYPFHRDEGANLQRMFNAVQPESYIRPHRHLDPPKSEAWVLLRGALVFFLFDDQGQVTEDFYLEAGGQQFGVDLEPGVFHSFIATVPDTLIYEVKSGPYSPTNDKDFASWAPAEGDPACGAYMTKLLDNAKSLPL